MGAALGNIRGLLWVVSRGNLLETEETRIVPKKIEFKTDLRRIIEWVLIATLVAIMIYALM